MPSVLPRMQRLHTIKFNDGTSARLDMRQQTWRLLPDLPPAHAANVLSNDEVACFLASRCSSGLPHVASARLTIGPNDLHVHSKSQVFPATHCRMTPHPAARRKSALHAAARVLPGRRQAV